MNQREKDIQLITNILTLVENHRIKSKKHLKSIKLTMAKDGIIDFYDVTWKHLTS